MANRYWVGGTANWDSTAGTKWASTSGGAGGATVPTSADDVFFDAASGANTVTVASTSNCKTLNFTGFTGTLAGTSSITAAGSVTFVSGMTVSWSGGLTISATGTLISAGKTLAQFIVNASGQTVTLGDALTLSSTLTVTAGTFTTNNRSVTASSLISNNSNTRVINLGSSTLTLSSSTPVNFTTATGLTINPGTSTIVANSVTAVTFGGNGQSFYNLSLTTTSAVTHAITGANTFNNITVTAPSAIGFTSLTFDSPQTLTGSLSTSGSEGNRRVWFRSSTYGIAQTLSIGAAGSLTNADFRDIYVIGSAAPISGTRIGNLTGCRGITFDAPKTVYWNLTGSQNWGANAWAATSGGTPNTNNFPLGQDTAVVNNAGLASTITMNLGWVPTVDMSARTTAVTIALSTPTTVYGDWKNGSGVSFSGLNALTFSGRNTQTIASAGKTFPCDIFIDSYGGTVQLDSAFNNSGQDLTITNGTFRTQNYSVTTNTITTLNTNVRAIYFGSSTITASNSITFGTSASTNLTFDAGTSSILNAGTITTGGQNFYNLTTNSTTGISTSISGGGSFNTITVSPPSGAAGYTLLTFSADTTVNTLVANGATAVRRVFVLSNTIGTSRTLTIGSLSATDCDFRDITIAGAAAGSSPTRAGDCGGNSGITFPAPKTVYWNRSGTSDWTDTGWATSSGGTPAINNFPLAQDTAVIDNANATLVLTLNNSAGPSTNALNIGNFDASARTTSMSLLINGARVYGNWGYGTGVAVSGSSEITFCGKGTQTITSNGITFPGPITIESVTGTVQLADALTLSSSRTLTLNSGTFDAVSYNVSTGLFSSSNVNPRTIRMGSGTWTLSGTGTVWTTATNTNLNFFKGTANIVLSNTSTTARTFAGGGLSYNKLTIGGTTGTSTLTITGDNQFTELASTKTVAHTIALGTTVQTFGAWTVKGTSGNAVTLTGTGTSHVLAGAATSGLDYLAMGSIGFAATSPGEFYAGANSTGTAAAPVYRTARPADSTRYWVGGTGNWSDTARWSTSSGGAGGATVPRSHDNVIFNSSSNATAYTATVDTVTGGIRCKALTIAGPASGNLTLAGTAAIVGVHGNVTFPASGLTRTYTGDITLSSSSTGLTFTTNGQSLASNLTVNGVDSSWTLGSALDIGSSAALTVTNGTFSTGGYSVTAQQLSSANSNSRTITLGSSTLSLAAGGTAVNFAPSTNLTFNANTSQINLTTQGCTVNGGDGVTFRNVSFSGGAGTYTISGANTFNNLTISAPASAGLAVFDIGANQTINGTLTLSAGTNATMRTFVRSDTIGTTRTLTCAAFSGTDADFRDITIAGAAAPVSGTRLGDCKGNSGITFDAPKTVWWGQAIGDTWGSGNARWSLTNGGTPAINNFPLAQDTAVFPSSPTPFPSSGNTITINAAYNIGTIDMSARTSNTMTLETGAQTPTIYGNWINGTGTTLSGTGDSTFSGRGSQTVTSAGNTFTQRVLINTPGGSVTLQDAFTCSRNASNAFQLISGTLDANGYNITFSNASGGFSSEGTGIRTLALGSGTMTIAGIGTTFDCDPSTNLTVTGTGTITMNSASNKTFAGGGISYAGITLNQGGAGQLTITGNNTFGNITNTYKTTGAATIALGATIQRVSRFEAAGEAGRVLTLSGTSAASPATLVFTGAPPVNSDYLNIRNVRAYNLSNTWYAGDNSTNSGSLGWIFAVGASMATGLFFLLF